MKQNIAFMHFYKKIRNLIEKRKIMYRIVLKPGWKLDEMSRVIGERFVFKAIIKILSFRLIWTKLKFSPYLMWGEKDLRLFPYVPRLAWTAIKIAKYGLSLRVM